MTSPSSNTTHSTMHSHTAVPSRTGSADLHTDEESGRTLREQPAEEEEYEKHEEADNPRQAGAPDDEQNDNDPSLRLHKTKSSIAEELPLGKEVVFIAVVCLAQFMTVRSSSSAHHEWSTKERTHRR